MSVEGSWWNEARRLDIPDESVAAEPVHYNRRQRKRQETAAAFAALRLAVDILGLDQQPKFFKREEHDVRYRLFSNCLNEKGKQAKAILVVTGQETPHPEPQKHHVRRHTFRATRFNIEKGVFLSPVLREADYDLDSKKWTESMGSTFMAEIDNSRGFVQEESWHYDSLRMPLLTHPAYAPSIRYLAEFMMGFSQTEEEIFTLMPNIAVSRLRPAVQ